MQPSEPASELSWPDGISQEIFLADYWQQQPLLLKQALPEFSTPLSADELAGLALEPETTPRLITQDRNGLFHLEYGPFDEDRFSTLTENNWSLLVTDVEKHLPDLTQYLAPFQFLPTWRIDDLMISYAPVGASVGAHVDQYDVFLLQASGKRRWLIDRNMHSQHSATSQGDLKLVDNFNATDEWELIPGDILYLPAGVAHHGIASEEPCTTWSIGFRSPAIRDMVMRIAEMIADSLPANRYRDGELSASVPGEITAAAVHRFSEEWVKATTLNTPQFTNLIGKLLTEAGVAEPDLSDMDESQPIVDSEHWVCKAPFGRMAWHQQANDSSGAVTLFVDGNVEQCSQTLAIQLCSGRALDINNLPEGCEADRSLLTRLYAQGHVIDA